MTSSPVLPSPEVDVHPPYELSPALSLADELTEAVIICDRAQRVHYINREATNLWHFGDQQLVGHSLKNVIHQQDRSAYQSRLERVASTGRPTAGTLRIIQSDGQFLRVNLRMARLGTKHDSYIAHLLTRLTDTAPEVPPSHVTDDMMHPSWRQFVVRTNAQGRIVEASQLFKMLVARPDAETIGGQQIEKFLKLDNFRDDVPLRESTDASTGTCAGQMRCAAGRLLPVKVEFARWTWQGTPTTLYRLVKDSALIWTSIVADYQLTQRESDVVLELCRGRSSAALAACLNISPATIRTHLRNIFSKIGVNSRVELVSLVFNALIGELVVSHNTETNGGQPASRQ